MFARYRMRRLLRKIPAQQLRVDLLQKAEREYQSSYYTDRLMEEHVKLLNMQGQLEMLSRNYNG
jgi:hypothetical protein